MTSNSDSQCFNAAGLVSSEMLVDYPCETGGRLTTRVVDVEPWNSPLSKLILVVRYHQLESVTDLLIGDSTEVDFV